MTISEKQLNANRGNAKKSTGPRTATGKNAARNNALKHGLRASTTVVLDDERQTSFEQFHDRFLEELKPVGVVEELLASRIVALAWRLNRVSRIESGLFNNRMRQNFTHTIFLLNTGSEPSKIAHIFESGPFEEALEKLCRYETGLERALLRIIDKLESLQAKRGPERVDQTHQLSDRITDKIVSKVFAPAEGHQPAESSDRRLSSK